MITETFYKRHILSAAALLASAAAFAASPAQVHIVNRTGDPVYFQSQGELGYTKIESPDTIVEVAGCPAYYNLMDVESTFYPVFLTDGARVSVEVTSGGVSITGDHEKENRWMAANAFLARTPESIKLYSPEWVAYNEREIARLDSLIDASGLDPQFSELQKINNRYVLLNQRLGGLALSKVFNRTGGEIETADDFYDFLRTLSFDDEKILYVPKWFDVVSKAMETKEAKGMIPVSNNEYLKIYASQIGNEKVRSRFLASMMHKVLQYNYLTDYERQMPQICGMIDDPEALAALDADYNRRREEASATAAGSEMPDFVCNDINGKEYRLSDMRGDYVIIDFWFTGCMPCIAEMPYFDKLATEFYGKGVKFLSLSVDTGDELFPRWQKMIRTKPHPEAVLCANLPEGFNSPLLKRLGIHGVPRIMLIDREGNIVESYAKRPSDPKLREQLQSLTAAR